MLAQNNSPEILDEVSNARKTLQELLESTPPVLTSEEEAALVTQLLDLKELVRLLREQVDNKTFIQRAACAKKWALVKALITIGSTEEEYASVLLLAAKAQQWQIVGILAKEDVALDWRCKATGDFATHTLMRLARDEDEEAKSALRILAEADADFALKNKENLTPIQIAANLGKWNLVKTLAEANKANFEDPEHYGSALIEAIKAQQWQIVSILARANASLYLNAENSAIHTLIQEARDEDEQAQRALSILMDVLVKTGADLDITNQEKLTPIQIAANLGKWNLVRILVKAKKASPGDPECYGNALVLAASEKRWELVPDLIKAGASGDWYCILTNGKQKSALDFALESNHYDMIQMLRIHNHQNIFTLEDDPEQMSLMGEAQDKVERRAAILLHEHLQIKSKEEQEKIIRNWNNLSEENNPAAIFKQQEKQIIYKQLCAEFYHDVEKKIIAPCEIEKYLEITAPILLENVESGVSESKEENIADENISIPAAKSWFDRASLPEVDTFVRILKHIEAESIMKESIPSAEAFYQVFLDFIHQQLTGIITEPFEKSIEKINLLKRLYIQIEACCCVIQPSAKGEYFSEQFSEFRELIGFAVGGKDDAFNAHYQHLSEYFNNLRVRLDTPQIKELIGLKQYVRNELISESVTAYIKAPLLEQIKNIICQITMKIAPPFVETEQEMINRTLLIITIAQKFQEFEKEHEDFIKLLKETDKDWIKNFLEPVANIFVPQESLGLRLKDIELLNRITIILKRFTQSFNEYADEIPNLEVLRNLVKEKVLDISRNIEHPNNEKEAANLEFYYLFCGSMFRLYEEATARIKSVTRSKELESLRELIDSTLQTININKLTTAPLMCTVNFQDRWEERRNAIPAIKSPPCIAGTFRSDHYAFTLSKEGSPSKVTSKSMH